MGKRGQTGMHNLGRKLNKSNAWKGGITYNRGYRYVYEPSHPNASKSGYVLEQKLVMSKYLNRLIQKYEILHHKNGNRLDNRIENLEIMDRRNHFFIHEPRKYYLPKVKETECSGCGVTFHLRRKPRFKHTYCSKKCFLSNLHKS